MARQATTRLEQPLSAFRRRGLRYVGWRRQVFEFAAVGQQELGERTYFDFLEAFLFLQFLIVVLQMLI